MRWSASPRASRLVPDDEADAALAAATVIFEGVPETLDAKREALARVCAAAPADAIIASTTSTILVTDLVPLVTHPQRLINAHWLNPAYIIPLVELSVHEGTSAAVRQRLRTLLQGIGKQTVECGPAPGYIVPRLQALIMNEAARMVEEGVATAEDIDKATRYGLGLRFAAMGVVEFIDFGGNDILYHASRYLSRTLERRALHRTGHRRHDDGRRPQRAEERPGLLRLPRHRRRCLSSGRAAAHARHAQACRPVQAPRHRLTPSTTEKTP